MSIETAIYINNIPFPLRIKFFYLMVESFNSNTIEPNKLFYIKLRVYVSSIKILNHKM